MPCRFPSFETIAFVIIAVNTVVVPNFLRDDLLLGHRDPNITLYTYIESVYVP